MLSNIISNKLFLNFQFGVYAITIFGRVCGVSRKPHKHIKEPSMEPIQLICLMADSIFEIIKRKKIHKIVLHNSQSSNLYSVQYLSNYGIYCHLSCIQCTKNMKIPYFVLQFSIINISTSYTRCAIKKVYLCIFYQSCLYTKCKSSAGNNEFYLNFILCFFTSSFYSMVVYLFDRL